MTTETLAPDIGWEPSGHLSDVALSAAADGEDTLLDAVMRAHLDACDACATRLGEVAFRAASVADAFATLAARDTATAAATAAEAAPGLAPAAPAQAPAPVIVALPARESAAPISPRTAALGAPVSARRRRIPVAAIAAAAFVAALGLVPQLLIAPAQLQQSLGILRKVAPSMIRLFPQALARAWSGQTAAAAVVTWTLAAVLVAAGLTIARKASKNLALNGGRQ